MSGRRMIDLCATPPLLAAFLLLLPVVWMAGKIHRYPGLFLRQRRVGVGGRPMQILKFRSLRWDGDDTSAGPIFRLLRRIGVDELPQAFNVLRGEMSCLGPRPLLERDLRRPVGGREAEWKHLLQLRQSVRPGISGVAQILSRGRERNGETWWRLFEADLWYVRHRCSRVDLLVFLLTPLYAVSLGRVTFPAALFHRWEKSVDPSQDATHVVGADLESLCDCDTPEDDPVSARRIRRHDLQPATGVEQKV